MFGLFTSKRKGKPGLPLKWAGSNVGDFHVMAYGYWAADWRENPTGKEGLFISLYREKDGGQVSISYILLKQILSELESKGPGHFA